MKQLVYTSSESYKMRPNDVAEILFQSRRNNNIANIAGLLIYLQGHFFQILEGEDSKVINLCETIKKDKRHDNVIILSDVEITERTFEQWSMAYLNLDDMEKTDNDNVKKLIKAMTNNKLSGDKLIKLIINFRDGSLDEYTL